MDLQRGLTRCRPTCLFRHVLRASQHNARQPHVHSEEVPEVTAVWSQEWAPGLPESAELHNVRFGAAYRRVSRAKVNLDEQPRVNRPVLSRSFGISQ